MTDARIVVRRVMARAAVSPLFPSPGVFFLPEGLPHS